MAKKKTSVLLPGGIQGLVHDLQNGKSNFAPKVIQTTVDDDDDDAELLNEDENATKTEGRDKIVKTSEAQQVNVGKNVSATTDDNRGNYTTLRNEESDNQGDRVEEGEVNASGVNRANSAVESTRSAGAVKNGENEEGKNASARGRRPKENTMREYHIVKDNSADSWDLFLDLATQYKNGGGKLATIYIDESLKNVLDRMKYAGQEKLSTSAILSSIVARFVYDHEDEIKKVLYSDLI